MPADSQLDQRVRDALDWLEYPPPATTENAKAARLIRDLYEALTARALPEEVAGVVKELRDFAKAYPEDQFPPLTFNEREWLRNEHPGLQDRIAAHMGRHFAKFALTAAATIERLSDEIAALREALEWYASPEIYKPHPHGLAFDNRDLSFHARAALSRNADNGR